MMTQVDEIRRKRHLQMTFPEFQEAISRVAEKLLVQSVGTSQVSFKLRFICFRLDPKKENRYPWQSRLKNTAKF